MKEAKKMQGEEECKQEKEIQGTPGKEGVWERQRSTKRVDRKKASQQRREEEVQGYEVGWEEDPK